MGLKPHDKDVLRAEFSLNVSRAAVPLAEIGVSSRSTWPGYVMGLKPHYKDVLRAEFSLNVSRAAVPLAEIGVSSRSTWPGYVMGLEPMTERLYRLPTYSCFVSGHDFSRAVKTARKTALAAEVRYFKLLGGDHTALAA
jgi:hypothetical protein